MAFYLGPVVLQIQNKSLVIPFPSGDHPFDPSSCSRPSIKKFIPNSCGDVSKSVWVRIGTPKSYVQKPEHPFIAVTIGYKQAYNFDEGSVEQVAAETNSWEGGRVREQKLDTESYAVVRSVPKILSNSPIPRKPGVTFYLVAKGSATPHIIVCSTSTDDDALPLDSACLARTGFLADEFPRQADGKFPFTLEYYFSAAQIDQAPIIERDIVATVLTFPRSRIKWPPGTFSDAPAGR